MIFFLILKMKTNVRGLKKVAAIASIISYNTDDTSKRRYVVIKKLFLFVIHHPSIGLLCRFNLF